MKLDPDDRKELESFVAGADKHNAIKRARRASMVQTILAEYGVNVLGLDNDGLLAAALAFLARWRA